MGHVGCFLLGLAAGVIGMWSSHNLDRSGCFLLGIICGIILKAFWLRPHMKRWYSIIMLMLGVHAFFFALIFLAIAVDLLVWAIAG